VSEGLNVYVGLMTYVIDNWNNGCLGIYRLYVGFGIQGICVYVTYIFMIRFASRPYKR